MTPAAREDAPGSYEHCRPCDVVMEGGESAFSLTIGVGQLYNDDAQSSRLLLLPWYGKEEEETKQKL